MSVGAATAAEGDDVEFVVTLSMAAGSDVALGWSTAADTATSGDDYTAVTAGTLTISAGDTTGTLTVSTAEDLLAEADETFTVTMTGTTLPSGVTLGTATATGTIEDDDTVMAAVTAGAPTVPEGSAASFEVALTGATSTADVVVTYTVTGTATPGTDYTAPSGSLTIAAGSSSGTITIQTTSDSVLDRGETLIVTLTGASTAAGTAEYSPTAATTTITDPGTATVSVGAATAAEGDDVEFVVTLSMAAGSDVALDWSTAADTATSGDDYTAVTAGTLTISAGDTTGTLTVSTEEDLLAEDDETFTVTITGTTLPSGVSLDTAAATGTGTIEDDDTVDGRGDGGRIDGAGGFGGELRGGADRRDEHCGRGGRLHRDRHGDAGYGLHGAERLVDHRRQRVEHDALDPDHFGQRAGPGRDADRDADGSEDRGGDRGVQPDRGDDHDRGLRHGDGLGGRREGDRGRRRRVHGEAVARGGERHGAGLDDGCRHRDLR